MHIPDGFVSPAIAFTTSLASAAVVGIALHRSRNQLGLKRSPVLGLTTAFIFAAQMINFPVAVGTSGHLLGGVLAATILGNPWLATLAISTVLLIQAFLFADGGITALGANILNIGIVGVWVGWMLTQTIQRLLGGSQRHLPLAAGIAAGLSVVAAAVMCGIELVLSGTATASLVLPAMSGVHILIGVGEGVITGGVLSYLQKTQPDLLSTETAKLQKWLVPVVGTFLLAGVLSLFASGWPDGLERVAENLGFIELADQVRVQIPTPFADYEMAGLGQLGTSIAGIVGTVVSFTVAFALGRFATPKNV